MARTWTRWLPAGAAVALVAGTVTLTSQAGAVDLPDRSPEEVLTLLAGHDVEAFSGTFETSADLGLPVPTDLDLGPGGPDLDDAGAALPDAEAAEALAALELLTGDHTGRIFVGGPHALRLQHLDGLAERTVVVTEEDLWLYDSVTDAALHLVLPELPDMAAHPGMPEHAEGMMPTPEQLASRSEEHTSELQSRG